MMTSSICYNDVIVKFKKDNNLLRFKSQMSSNVKLVINEVSRNQDKPLGVRFSSTRWRSTEKKVKWRQWHVRQIHFLWPQMTSKWLLSRVKVIFWIKIWKFWILIILNLKFEKIWFTKNFEINNFSKILKIRPRALHKELEYELGPSVYEQRDSSHRLNE